MKSLPTPAKRRRFPRRYRRTDGSSWRSGRRLNGRDLTRCLPTPRQEFFELVDLGASGDHALEHVGQIFLRIDTNEFCAVDKRRDDRPCSAAFITASEQIIAPAESNGPHRSLHGIAV